MKNFKGEIIVKVIQEMRKFHSRGRDFKGRTDKALASSVLTVCHMHFTFTKALAS